TWAARPLGLLDPPGSADALLIVPGELHVAPLSVDRGEVAVVADHAGTGVVPAGKSVRAWKTTSSVPSGATVTEAKNTLCAASPTVQCWHTVRRSPCGCGGTRALTCRCRRAHSDHG